MKRLAIGLAVLGTLLLGSVLLVLTVWPTEVIERVGSAMTGRVLRVDGGVDVRWGWTVGIRAQDLSLGNAPWRESKPLVRARDLALEIRVPALFSGRADLPTVELSGVEIDLARNEEGRANWELAPPADATLELAEPETRTELPRLGEVVIQDFRLSHDQPDSEPADLWIETAEFGPAADDAEGVRLAASGEYAQRRFDLQGSFDSLHRLTETSRPYGVQVELALGDTRLEVAGDLVEPLELERIAAQISVEGPNLATFYELFGLPLVPTPPFSLSGSLDREGMVWKIESLEGRLGDSVVAGDFALDLSDERPFIRSALTSRKLDFDDLAPMIGAPPQVQDGETASPAQRREAREEQSDTDVIPDEPIQLDALRAADAEFTLEATEVQSPSAPIDSFLVELSLEDGRLDVQRLDLGLAGGELRLRGVVDGTSSPPAVEADVQLRGVRLGRFGSDGELVDESKGVVQGGARLEATGRSLAQMLAGARGAMAVYLADGQVSHLLVELVGLDVFDTLGLVLTGDDALPIRCAVVALAGSEGAFEVRSLLLDTPDTRIRGRGTVHFDTEELDLLLEPHPKDFSLLSFRAPIRVKGIFSSPSIHPDPLGIDPEGDYEEIASIALTPLLGLAAPLDIGWAEESDCRRLMPERK